MQRILRLWFFYIDQIDIDSRETEEKERKRHLLSVIWNVNIKFNYDKILLEFINKFLKNLEPA